MTTSHNAAEQIYLDVYSEAAENANYLQPSSGTDFLLPETIIVALTSTILVAFLQGCFQEAGKDIVNLVKERVFNKGKLHEVDADTIVKALESKIDHIQENPERLKHAEQQIETDLLSLGMAPEVAKRIAKRTVEIVLQKNK